jgi:hypothetical protein
MIETGFILFITYYQDELRKLAETLHEIAGDMQDLIHNFDENNLHKHGSQIDI